ncbi:hypothetical protein G5T42_05440 [Microbacterium sp. 4R-513]|uniref:hypothetical protein n=1 Tax=Microbacterium sp. 4R-513 TaxID=2567934 RepID=UPI0013E2042A|nr:hypothetical protein [Microbacterium sp. 4R-513]QIG39001.1 hypothetical protein G5T42_05440 [Microbacterium sp. 4R-513]
MDAAAHPARVPVIRLLAIGIAVSFAYLLLALFLGFGSTDARADDGSDRGGLLGGVTDVVSTTVGGVTDVVQGTTQAVTTTVQQVARVAPAPVQPVVQPVVSTVTTTVQAVVQPVAEVTGTGVVGSVVQPVVEVVNAVPVVGQVVQAVGLDEALTDVAATADTTVHGVLTTVDDTASGLGGTRPPLVNVPDVIPPFGAPSVSHEQSAQAALAGVTAAGALVPTWAAPAVWDVYTHALPAFTAIASASSAAAGLMSTGAQVGGILSSALVLGVCAPGGSSPMGSGGAGPGALALAAFAPLFAYRAWMRRSGWNDDVAPPAPTYDTDVAPD